MHKGSRSDHPNTAKPQQMGRQPTTEVALLRAIIKTNAPQTDAAARHATFEQINCTTLYNGEVMKAYILFYEKSYSDAAPSKTVTVS